MAEADLGLRFERALRDGDGLAGAHCVQEWWMRGAMSLHVEQALERLWASAAGSIPEWLPMHYVDWLPAVYDIAGGFTAKAKGRSNIYLVLLDYGRERSHPYGLYVGMSSYSPAQRFDQHKAGIRAAGSVLKRGVEVLTGPTLHLQYIARAEAARIEEELAQALAAAGLIVKRRSLMLLIGMLDSPFVRRVAVSAELLGMKFEHRNWSVGKDFDLIRQYNPLGRVPTLVLPDGEALLESSAILDYLDELAGPERALVPRSGKERRDVLRLMAVASGAAEKGVLQIYERVFRPAEKRHAAWVERCLQQVQGGLRELDRAAAARAGEWLVGDRMTQADVTTACVFTFLCEALGRAPLDAEALSSLGSLAARCEALPAFRALRANFSAP